MRNTICEKLMWFSMTPTIFRFIRKNWTDLSISQIKRKSKRNYKEMIKRTPDIGPMSQNPLRAPLAGGMIWISIYQAMGGEMSHEQFRQMVIETTESPMVRRAFSKQNPFTAEAQSKKIEKERISNAVSNSEFNWVVETVLGRDEEEYTTFYHQCGLCALGRQENCEDLIPYMCEMDFITVEMMGGVLHRSGTLATGAPCCDFYICKKGSKWDGAEN